MDNGSYYMLDSGEDFQLVLHIFYVGRLYHLHLPYLALVTLATFLDITTFTTLPF